MGTEISGVHLPSSGERKGTVSLSRVIAAVLSAGRGERLGASCPKAFVPLLGHPLMAWTLAAFEAVARVDEVIVVTPAGEEARTTEIIDHYGFAKSARVITGGPRRQDSSRRGVESARLVDEQGMILIHDVARPFFSPALIDRLLDAAARADGAVPGLSPVETIKRIDAAGRVLETPDRALLRAIQTPQAFRLPAIASAFETVCPEDGSPREFTDDAAVMEAAGGQILVVSGENENLKITVAEDMNRAAAFLETRPELRRRVMERGTQS